MTRIFTQLANLSDEEETEVKITYTYSPGYRATWTQPAEGPEVEIIGAEAGNGYAIELSEADEDRIWKWLIQNHDHDDEWEIFEP